ncbi:MAG: glycosyltransferase [Dorea sp.]|nr:glycosyltransferase [Coprobacillus sp.]MCI9618495.1 glycosyltransferase [Dorea sp.]
MKNELLSVIVPIYNAETYLRKCIDSILHQTYTPLEIILVDDGSTDSSRSICIFYAKKYNNISTIHIRNSGITKARLKGIEQARGSRVTFVDADDWIDKDYYQSVCTNDDSDIIATEIYSYGEEYTIKRDLFLEEGIYNRERILEVIVPNMLWNSELGHWGIEPSLCTKIFRKGKILQELKKVEKVGSNYGEDSMVTFPLMFTIDKLKVVKKAFYYHRQRKQGEIAEYIKNDNFIIKVHKVYEYLAKAFKMAGYYNVMKQQLDNFYIQSIDLKKQCYPNCEYGFAAIFPFESVTRESKVILYGAGTLGRQYIDQNSEYNFCNIILLIDQNSKNGTYKSYSVEKPEIIRQYSFDFIIIAIDNYYIAMDVKKKLSEMNVPENKIIWQSTRIIRI